MFINEKKRAIELTTAEANKAFQYGTTEYEDLQNVRRDYPRYKVQVIKVRKKDPLKNLKLDKIQKYVATHDDEQRTKTKELEILIGKFEHDDNDIKLDQSASFVEIKGWFLKSYPEIEKYIKDSKAEINRILGKTA